eukprot:6204838-Pleurochrysis_carterae.AAC.3
MHLAVSCMRRARGMCAFSTRLHALEPKQEQRPRGALAVRHDLFAICRLHHLEIVFSRIEQLLDQTGGEAVPRVGVGDGLSDGVLGRRAGDRLRQHAFQLRQLDVECVQCEEAAARSLRHEEVAQVSLAVLVPGETATWHQRSVKTAKLYGCTEARDVEIRCSKTR